MSQLSYDLNQPVAVSGVLFEASGGPKKSATYNNPTVAIPFGRAVAKIPTDDDGCKLPTGPADVILGISERTLSTVHDHYSIGSAVATLNSGRIYVQVEVPVTPDDPVFVRHTPNGPLTERGIFRNNADGGNAIQIPEARYLTAASAGQLAVVDINLP